MNNIEALEKRYQALHRDFQAGKIDEATFGAEVDSLQFQDEWGRYWMIGAQSGAWHYYDGQAWHQADPHDADKLPFMDEEGRYWQRGAKSGDWYYYQPDSDEWVKPSREDGMTPPRPVRQQRSSKRSSKRATAQPRARSQQAPPQSQPQSQSQSQSQLQTQARMRSVDNGPQTPANFEADLFQDDEGRYWSMGTKSGQWYFYDHEGWHPAQEFQARVVQPRQASQVYQQQPAYQQPAYQAQPTQAYPQQQPPPPSQSQGYGYPPQQPGMPQPTQTYPPQQPGPQAYASPPPGQQTVIPPQQPAQPAPAPQETPQTEAKSDLPEPPASGRSESGAWYYLDGDRWFKYSDDEPAEEVTPPDPEKVIDQKPQAKRKDSEEIRVESKREESVVAELFEEEDEPPPEVVDVEIVTVIEAEPDDIIEEQRPAARQAQRPAARQAQRPAARPEPEPEPEPTPEPTARRRTATTMPPPRREEEIRPRRSSSSRPTRSVEPRRRAAPGDEAGVRRSRTDTESRPSRERGSREPSRPVAPRKREAAHEPTIIIPTDSAASNISSKAGNKPPSRPVKPVDQSSKPPSRPNKPASRPVKPASRPVKPASRPVKPASRPVTPVTANRSAGAPPDQQRRARENTLPLEPAKVDMSGGSAKNVSRNPQEVNRSSTQAMPQVVRSGPERASAAREATAPLGPVPKPAAAAAAAGAAKSTTAQPEKEGYTLGDILRSFPSTIWTFVGGMAILLIFALVILALWIGFQGAGGGSDEGSDLAAVSNVTPTLGSAPPNATPTLGPTATVEPEGFEPPEPGEYILFSSDDLDFTIDYPENWVTDETGTFAIFSPSEEGLDPEALQDASFRIVKTEADDVEISDLLADILSEFPVDAETLNEGTINIASQPWTSAQIRYEDENLGGAGIATLAVTDRDGVGYTLVAASPAETWNAMQPMYQEMINSFRFGATEVAAASTAGSSRGTPEADETGAAADETDDSDEETTAADEDEDEAAAEEDDDETATPTPEAEATPVVHVIESGDTLLAIANQYGVDVDLLTDENGITNPSGLTLGQELIIPFTAEELAEYNARNNPSAAGSGSSAAATGDDDEEEEAADDEESTAAADSEEADADTEESAAAPADTAAESDSEAASLSGRIAYPAFNPGPNTYDLWMLDVATNEQTIIATEASQPAFNRDGSLLAYRSWALGNQGIYFRDFVGGRGGLVTKFVEDGLPTWSPDGYSFAFMSRREGDRVARIYRGNQEGSEDFSIGFQGQYPAAFPDGRLVVKGCSITGDCGIYVMGANGGGETKISSDAGDTAPAVSPDGSKIAFMSSGRGATDWEIWVMNADGSNPQRLTNSRSNEGLPAWSPDGNSIAYVSDQGGLWAIWVMNADGSNQRKLVNMSGSPDGEILRAGDDSRGWLEERITWAP